MQALWPAAGIVLGLVYAFRTCAHRRSQANASAAAIDPATEGRLLGTLTQNIRTIAALGVEGPLCAEHADSAAQAHAPSTAVVICDAVISGVLLVLPDYAISLMFL